MTKGYQVAQNLLVRMLTAANKTQNEYKSRKKYTGVFDERKNEHSKLGLDQISV